MRTFWFFIAVLVIAGAIVAVLSDSPSNTREESQDLAVTQPVLTEETEQAEQTQQLASELATAAEARQESTKTETAPTATEADAEEPTEESGTLTIGLDREIAHATIVPGNIKALDGDNLSVDGEFNLRGQGTKESPYEPTWDYLFSAADTYQPRLGEDEIPQRIALLDGKWIRISGYTAFPLVVGETSEMLVMLNKWDGCCIGVPPTPFDAIEVRLTQPVDRGPKHQINFGSVTGRMKVDPYLIENWLVGLYILEESSLTTDL